MVKSDLSQLYSILFFPHQGHSQGSILGRHWPPTSETRKIGHLVGIAPIRQGTTLNGISVFAKTLGLLGADNVFLKPSRTCTDADSCRFCVYEEVEQYY